MIQDIFPMHLSNEYHKKVPQADSFLMIFKDNRILAKNDGQVCYLTYKELSEICRGMGKEIPACVYLFSIGEDDYFLTDPGEGIEVLGFVYYKMFETRTMQPKERVLAAATAWHLSGTAIMPIVGDVGINWYIVKNSGCFHVRTVTTWFSRK